jgi:Nif-specific regulatory protein
MRRSSHPEFVFRSGPRNGQTVTLDDGELSFGRDASNHVHLEDRALSRRHCLISARDEICTIQDLQSLNGTFVNGRPIREHVLRDGDEISIGGSVIMFLARGKDPDASGTTLEIDDVPSAPRSTIELLPEDGRYLGTSTDTVRCGASSRAEADLAALVRLSTSLAVVRERHTLQRRLIELCFEAIPADVAAVALVDQDHDVLTSVTGLTRTGERCAALSRTVARQAMAGGVSILSNDVVTDARFEASRTLASSPVAAILCAPLKVGTRTLGVLYFSASHGAARFDPDHLQFATAAAALAAVALENLAHLEWLQDEAVRLRGESRLTHEMIGEGARIREVYARIAKIGPTESTVLIGGESGTGKELAARAIHANSNRASGPFVAINCAALTESLLESELFGHEKGAFTGAIAQKRGKLEAANRGTVFLDEVGELAPPLQAKLLRVLQEREFERVGGNRPIKVDIRLLAATNRDLKAAIENRSFRSDLYYRLNVVSLLMPPLRDRREDIPLLASFFVRRHAARCNRTIEGISVEARRKLTAYDWPGNVRELENALERAIVLGSTDRILVEDLPEALIEAPDDQPAELAKYHDAINQMKRDLLHKAIEQAGGNYTAAARLLGLHPNYVFRLIKRLGMKAQQS